MGRQGSKQAATSLRGGGDRSPITTDIFKLKAICFKSNQLALAGKKSSALAKAVMGSNVTTLNPNLNLAFEVLRVVVAA